MTQNEALIELLKQGPITAIEALTKINCLRLAARINNLRNEGWEIETETVHANGKNFARYKLKADQPKLKKRY